MQLHAKLKKCLIKCSSIKEIGILTVCTMSCVLYFYILLSVNICTYTMGNITFFFKFLLSWDVMQSRLLVSYRSFGTPYRSSLQMLSSLRRPIGSPERLFSDYQSTLCNIPKDLIYTMVEAWICTLCFWTMHWSGPHTLIHKGYCSENSNICQVQKLSTMVPFKGACKDYKGLRSCLRHKMVIHGLLWFLLWYVHGCKRCVLC
jgi:hypothetical protein